MKLIKHVNCDSIITCEDINDRFGNLSILTIVSLYMKTRYNSNGMSNITNLKINTFFFGKRTTI